MCLLLESVKIKDNIIYNIEYHNIRLNNSRKILFGCDDFIDLKNYIDVDKKSNGLFKCRIICNEKVVEMTYEPYKMRKISTIKAVYDNEIDYTHKTLDKEKFNKLLFKKGNCDDILIIKNGLITDTSFSNVIFYDGNKYLTPANPLLKGTNRQKLIDEKVIFEDDIKPDDFNKFKYIQFINAMVDIEDGMILDIDRIFF